MGTKTRNSIPEALQSMGVTGNKFAILAIHCPHYYGDSIKFHDNVIVGPIDLNETMSSGFEEFIGISESEEIKSCNLGFISYMSSDHPDMIDKESSELYDKISILIWILLVFRIHIIGRPYIIKGFLEEGKFIARMVHPFGHVIYWEQFPFRLAKVHALKQIGDVRQMYMEKSNDRKHWRFRRGLEMMLKGFTEPRADERIVYFVRSLEALFFLQKKEGEKQFADRMSLIVDLSHMPLFANRLYTARNAVLHMNGLWRNRKRYQKRTKFKTEIDQYLHVTALVACEVYFRILSRKSTYASFSRDDSITQYWLNMPKRSWVFSEKIDVKLLEETARREQYDHFGYY
ncbi:MAG: hypothetical protein KF824_00050 [Fimbriimonadaceae bacterium]|nr:MAG: hypothetical protein KF824_00050 [Fimbriimonadaceae bacterium]